MNQAVVCHCILKSELNVVILLPAQLLLLNDPGHIYFLYRHINKSYYIITNIYSYL